MTQGRVHKGTLIKYYVDDIFVDAAFSPEHDPLPAEAAQVGDEQTIF
jgi:hypothetical protein